MFWDLKTHVIHMIHSDNNQCILMISFQWYTNTQHTNIYSYFFCNKPSYIISWARIRIGSFIPTWVFPQKKRSPKEYWGAWRLSSSWSLWLYRFFFSPPRFSLLLPMHLFLLLCSPRFLNLLSPWKLSLPISTTTIFDTLSLIFPLCQ